MFTKQQLLAMALYVVITIAAVAIIDVNRLHSKLVASESEVIRQSELIALQSIQLERLSALDVLLKDLAVSTD
jgi:cell division protein FtsL